MIAVTAADNVQAALIRALLPLKIAGSTDIVPSNDFTLAAASQFQQ